MSSLRSAKLDYDVFEFSHCNIYIYISIYIYAVLGIHICNVSNLDIHLYEQFGKLERSFFFFIKTALEVQVDHFLNSFFRKAGIVLVQEISNRTFLTDPPKSLKMGSRARAVFNFKKG